LGLVAQVRRPVTEQRLITEVLTPIVIANTAANCWCGIEADEVTVDPARDGIGSPQPGQRFGRHRAVIGEEAVELGTGATQAVEGVEERLVSHPCNLATSTQLEVNSAA
jgi:hypothetical protein